MLDYCIIKWTKEEIRSDHLYWPLYSYFKIKICQALNIYINAKEAVRRKRITPLAGGNLFEGSEGI